MRSILQILFAGLVGALQARSDAKVVQTDVVVIGGGGSGAHAAVRLTDLGQDVILVEKQAELVRQQLLILLTQIQVVTDNSTNRAERSTATLTRQTARRTTMESRFSPTTETRRSSSRASISRSQQVVALPRRLALQTSRLAKNSRIIQRRRGILWSLHLRSI